MFCEVMQDAKGCYRSKQLANGIISVSIEECRPLSFFRLSVYMFLVHGWQLAFTGRGLFRESPMIMPWGVTYSTILDAFLAMYHVDDERLLQFNAFDYLDDNDLVHEPEAFVPACITDDEKAYWTITHFVCELYMPLSDAELREYLESDDATSIKDTRTAVADHVPEITLAKHFMRVARLYKPGHNPFTPFNHTTHHPS